MRFALNANLTPRWHSVAWLLGILCTACSGHLRSLRRMSRELPTRRVRAVRRPSPSPLRVSTSPTAWARCTMAEAQPLVLRILALHPNLT